MIFMKIRTYGHLKEDCLKDGKNPSGLHVSYCLLSCRPIRSPVANWKEKMNDLSISYKLHHSIKFLTLLI